MKQEYSIDWDLLFQNYANFCAWEGDEAPCSCLLFGSSHRIVLPLFCTRIDHPTIQHIISCLSSDLSLIGILRLDSGDLGLSLTKGGLELHVSRAQLFSKNRESIRQANPFLVDVPGADASFPRYVTAKLTFECTLRFGQEERELASAYERQLALLDTCSFLTADKILITSRSTAKDKSPLLSTGPSPAPLTVLQCLSPPPGEEESIVPIVRVARGAQECRLVRVPIVVSTVVLDGDSAKDLHGRLVEGVRRRLEQTHHELQKGLRTKDGSLKITSCLFHPPGWSRHLHLQTPAAFESEAVATEWRRGLHRRFNLPRSSPCLRQGQNLLSSTPGLLRDVHKHLRNYKPCGEVAVVRSGYDYYHYMQQGFDDCGWGCAYRSGQTIVSWFLINGLADGTVPTHRDIQRCLVEIGDKQPKFEGSKQWIGSTELGFVFETKFNISYKIMSVNSGVEVAERARELQYHFKRVGTPIMIGGGQLAHTILGVDFNDETGEARFLVLDPHYTGRDEVNAVLNGGGCEWKTAKFWNATAFYNLLLPQIPVNII